jgi:hypothetical protein
MGRDLGGSNHNMPPGETSEQYKHYKVYWTISLENTLHEIIEKVKAASNILAPFP